MVINCSEETNVYLNNKDAASLLQITLKKWAEVKKTIPLKEVSYKNYLKSDIEKIYEFQKSFLNDYLSVSEVREIIKKNMIEKLPKYPIPHYANTGKFYNKTTAFKKVDINIFIANGYAKDEYYLKNNLPINTSSTRRTKQIFTEKDEFNNMSFNDFEALYYNTDEIKTILIRQYQDIAEYIIIPVKFKQGKFNNKVKAYRKIAIELLLKRQIEKSKVIKITKEEIKSNKYISFDESIDLLEVHRGTWLNIRKLLNLDEPRTGYNFRNDVLRIVDDYNSFLKSYCSYDEAMKLHPSPYDNKLDNVITVEIPFHLRIKLLADYRTNVYSRLSLNEEVNKYNYNQNIIKNSYTRSAAMQILNLSSYSFDDTIAKLNITSVQLPNETGSARYYKKDDINSIKVKQQIFFATDELLNYNEVLSLCTIKGWIDSKEVNSLMIELKPWNKIGKFSNFIYAYPKKELLNILESKENYLRFIDEVDLSDPLKSLIDKLRHSNTFNYDELSSKYFFATQFLHNFFDEKILTSRRSVKNLNALIRQIIIFFGYIYELLECSAANDIHALKTESIIEYSIKNQNFRKSTFTFSFFNYIYSYIVYNENLSNSLNKKIFDINKLSNIFKIKDHSKDLLDADIYDLKTFLKIIEHCTDINYHVKISLDEIRESCTYIYASYWLFICININNAWRVGDIINIPIFDIEDILSSFQIFDLNWFDKNKLSLEESRLILSRITYNQYIVSKTKSYNCFFISDDLAISVATSIVILTISRTDKLSIEVTPLMQFNTKYNYPSTNYLDSFFLNDRKQNFEDDFQFRSNKINSTLLTFISAIQNDDCSEKSLKLAQNIRAHKNLNSLLNYIKVNSDTLDTLTRNLFNRGEFGYIYSSIANSLNIPINTLKSPENIDQVSLFKELISSPWEFEVFSGIMNSYEKDAKEILNKINIMTFDEIQQKFTDIVLKKYPSKANHIQCFIGYDNCTSLSNDCVKCKNAIPTLLSLNTISKKLLLLLLKYNSTTIIGEKVKLSNSIFYYKQRMIEAISMYGKDLVYSYISISREDFLYLFSIVEEPNKITKDGDYHIC